MNAKKFYLLIGIVFVLGLLPQQNVSADMGPKPTMTFDFVQEVPGSALKMVSWSLINCENSECTNTGEIIPVDFGFDCADSHCDAGVYYGIQHEYFQMEITFSDGVTRKSNVFTRKYFDARYTVTIEPDILSVRELRGSNANQNVLVLAFVGYFFVYPLTILVTVVLSIVIVVSGLAKKINGREVIKRLGKVILWALIVNFAFTGLVLSAIAFVLNLAIEVVLVLVCWWYLKLPDKRIIYGVLIANVFTQPLLVLSQTLLLPHLIYTMTSIIGFEFGIWLVETIIVYFVQKGQLPFVKILLLTLMLNIASFGIGLLLPI